LFDRYWAGKNSAGSHWYKFQKAVTAHRDLALDKFKPLFEKVKLPI